MHYLWIENGLNMVKKSPCIYDIKFVVDKNIRIPTEIIELVVC